MERVMLVLDDEPSILRSLKRVFRGRWTVLTTDDPVIALTWLEQYDVSVVLSDYRMKGLSGVDFLSRVKIRHPHTQRYLLSGQADFEAVSKAVNSGACHRFLCKPWQDDQLCEHMEEAWQSWLSRRAHADRPCLISSTALSNMLVTGELTLVYRVDTAVTPLKIDYCLATRSQQTPLPLSDIHLSPLQYEQVSKWALITAQTALALQPGVTGGVFELEASLNDTNSSQEWLSWESLSSLLHTVSGRTASDTELLIL